MLEDKILIWRLKGGCQESLSRIYKQYYRYLLTIAANLLGDPNGAEDVVQDVFVTFVRIAPQFQLTGNLKSFLITCVANRARDYIRKAKRRATVTLDDVEPPIDESRIPARLASQSEQLLRVRDALAQLTYEQREVIVMRVHGKMRFRQIAKMQKSSIKTIQSRYRYGLDRIKSLLNGELER